LEEVRRAVDAFEDYGSSSVEALWCEYVTQLLSLLDERDKEVDRWQIIAEHSPRSRRVAKVLLDKVDRLQARVQELEHDHGNALAVTEEVMAERAQLRHRVKELEAMVEADDLCNDFDVKEAKSDE